MIMLVLGVSLIAGASAFEARAQVTRPGDDRIEVELPREEGPAPELELPPIPREPAPPPTPEEPPAQERSPAPAVPGERAEGEGVVITRIDVTGVSVFAPEELAAVTRPYLDRRLDPQELVALRDAVTRLYIDAGYVSSGAVIPEQTVEDGRLVIQVVEGRLTEVTIEGLRSFRDYYIRARIQPDPDAPLDVHELERRLQRLRRDSRIESIDARLKPGAVRGESSLVVTIRERIPLAAKITAANDESPAVGTSHGRYQLGLTNVTGFGDRLSGYYGNASDLSEWQFRYSLPVYKNDTQLFTWYEVTRSSLNDFFPGLEIRSKADTLGVGIESPVYWSPEYELRLALQGEFRRHALSMGDSPLADILGPNFDYIRGAEDGEVRISVLRARVEWLHRKLNRVAALRSTFNFGLDILGATNRPSPGLAAFPDGTFFSWLGQLLWIERLPDRFLEAELHFRTDVQVAADPLFTMEQFSIGGGQSVRGYREDALIRDSGITSSLELRVPVLRDSLGAQTLQAASFVDFGHSWDEDHFSDTRPLDTAPQTIASVGGGFLYDWNRRWRLSAYYGYRIVDMKRRGSSMQEHGVHLAAELVAF